MRDITGDSLLSFSFLLALALTLTIDQRVLPHPILSNGQGGRNPMT